MSMIRLHVKRLGSLSVRLRFSRGLRDLLARKNNRADAIDEDILISGVPYRAFVLSAWIH